MNIATARKRIGQVLRIDSIDSTDSDFLATHVPFRKIVNNFIFNDSKNDESYLSSIRYFNLIQGNQVNSSNYVLNYPLYIDAIKEIRKSYYILEDNELNETEDAVKDKREIFELTLKTISKVHKVVEEETALARNTAIEVLEFFDNIDIEDELEASDISEKRTITQ